MSLERDVGDAVGAAMTFGLALGLQRQRDKNVGSWKHYAHQLEGTLANTEKRLYDQSFEVYWRGHLLSDRDKKINQLEAQLRQAQATVATQQAQLSKQKEQTDSAKKKLVEQINCTVVLHHLYEQLVDEINNKSDPANFDCLDIEARDHTIDTKFRELDKTHEFDKGYEVNLKPPKRSSTYAEELRTSRSRFSWLGCRVKQLMKAFSRQCVRTAVAHGLYEQLVAEVRANADPSNFPSLAPENRLKIAAALQEKFESETFVVPNGYKLDFVRDTGHTEC